MTVRVTALGGGTDFGSGETPLASADLNDTFGATFRFIGSDFVEGSIANSTAETEVAEVIVAANTVVSELIVMASVRYRNDAGSSGKNDGTFRLRTGTSSTATSNTLRTTVELTFERAAADAAQAIYGGFIMFRLTTAEEDFTGEVQVHITGQNDEQSAATESFCDYLIVFGR